MSSNNDALFLAPMSKPKPAVPSFAAPKPPTVVKSDIPVQSQPAPITTGPSHNYVAPSWGGLPKQKIEFEIIRNGVELEPIVISDTISNLTLNIRALVQRVKKSGTMCEYIRDNVNSLQQTLENPVTEDFTTLSTLSYITIGRTPANHIPLEHESLSRMHAVIQFREKDGQMYIYDNASTHGTKLNKTKLTAKEHIKIFHGDILSFGASNRMFIVNHSNGLSRQDAVDEQIKAEEAYEKKLTFITGQLKARNVVDIDVDVDDDDVMFERWLAWDQERETTGKVNVILAAIGKTDKQQVMVSKMNETKVKLEHALSNADGEVTDKVKKIQDTYESQREGLLQSFLVKRGHESQTSVDKEDDDDDDFFDRTKKTKSTVSGYNRLVMLEKQKTNTTDALADVCVLDGDDTIAVKAGSVLECSTIELTYNDKRTVHSAQNDLATVTKELTTTQDLLIEQTGAVDIKSALNHPKSKTGFFADLGRQYLELMVVSKQLKYIINREQV